MMRKPWTYPEITDVQRWRELGMTYAEIAAALGRTQRAVRNQCSQHGIHKGAGRKPRTITPDANLAEEIAAARAERTIAPPYKVGLLEW